MWSVKIALRCTEYFFRFELTVKLGYNNHSYRLGYNDHGYRLGYNDHGYSEKTLTVS
jgi:hypothetical protein